MKFRIIVSVFLALLTAAFTPLRVLADAAPVYISEVMVGMGETPKEAKKALTDKGFTVLDRDLNEGAGSVYKTDKYVYIGYKTTKDANEAITDLAVMNMNGGYSFADYEALMDKYRDSQIRPFIDKFLATINEYRENYRSDIPGNKAKADFAYSVLSHIIEDDSGSNMGDLLLNPTKEERGFTDDQYKALSEENKRKTVDLTTALMQGNTQVVFLMEQMLAMASDTNETTWIERLSELGPDGLDKKYAEAGVRPTDAKKEMAALYGDTAKVLLSGWIELRTALLEYDMEVSSSDNGGTEDAGEIELPSQYDIPVSEKSGDTPDLENIADDIEGALDSVTEIMEYGAELGEASEGSDVAGIYGVLKELPYGDDGTLYDFFTLDYGEVSGGNISALYPLASTLTEGQIAALDLLPLKLLVQIGATVGDAFEQFSPENSNLFEGVDFLGGISIYLDVNRELFGDKVALTSEALREGFDRELGWMKPDSDLLGLSKLTTLSWAVTGFFGAATLVSVIKCARAPGQYQTALDKFYEVDGAINDFFDNCNIADQGGGRIIKDWDEFYEKGKIRVDTWTKPGYSKVTFEMDVMEEGLDGVEYVKTSEVMEKYYDKSYNIDEHYDNIKEFKDQFEDAKRNSYYAQDRWFVLEVVFGVVFAVLTAISIGLTIYDLYRFYNIDYTPIPKYIVDEADITSVDGNGKQIVVRNDAAYYKVVTTNRPETHGQYKALNDYADLNGDVGKEWLALYTAALPGGEPIIADSFTVVTGSTRIPDGYEKSIHMFGSTAAANLTDSRYTYNDDLNGIYVYYKTEKAANSAETASVFAGSTLVLAGTGGAAVGAALGAGTVALAKRRKTSDEK